MMVRWLLNIQKSCLVERRLERVRISVLLVRRYDVHREGTKAVFLLILGKDAIRNLRRRYAPLIGSIDHVRVEHRGQTGFGVQTNRFHQHVTKLGARQAVTQDAGIVEIHEDVVDRPLDASAAYGIDRGFVRQ